MTNEKPSGLTYAQAGVDIDAGNAMVDQIKPLVRATRRPGADAEIGGFGGLFDLKAAGFEDPILVAANDGVGTKVKIAIETGIHHTIGVDLVAMCVNDIIVQGAEPLFFLDYFATGKLTPEIGVAIVRGIADGCVQAGCALVGGETAEMPGLYARGDYDLAGFAVGAAERGTLLPSGVAAGDVLIGLPSSGVHSNGFSLVRRIVEASGLAWDAPAPFAPGRSLGEALLDPTRIYVKPLLAALKAGDGIKALAHITGGGFPDNIPRVLPDDVGVLLDLDAIPVPPVFGWLSRAGGVAETEMLRTFNCGIGMIVVAASEHAESVIQNLRNAGESPVLIGENGRPRGHGTGAHVGTPEALMTCRRIAILISGRGSNSVSLIDAARAPGFPGEIALVLSNRPDAAGLARAREEGIETVAIDHTAYADRAGFDAALDEALIARRIDLICLAGFMRVLTSAFVERWSGRMINIHPSLLPLFRGTNTHQRALDAGRPDPWLHGAFRGAGARCRAPSSPRRRSPSCPGTRPADLAARVLVQEHVLYPQALRMICDGRARLENGRVTFAEGWSV